MSEKGVSMQDKNNQIPDICDEMGSEELKREDVVQAQPQTAVEPEVSVVSNEAVQPPVEPKSIQRTAFEPQAVPSMPKQAQYCWNYEDQVKHDNKNKSRRGSGALTYAIIMTVAFTLCLVTLLGVVLMENGTFTPNIVRTIFIREHNSEGGVLTIPEIADKVKPSVVGIEVTFNGGTGVGTGIILTEDGYIATNYHVVEDGTSYRVVMHDNTEYAATYVGGDEMSDLAVLKINTTGLRAAEIGNSDELIVGETVVAIGTPSSLDFAGTTTDGIISAINRDAKIYDNSGIMIKRMTLIQTNAEVNPGNSGGPLVNDRGQVVGVVNMKLGYNYDGIGFAIPINGAMKVLNDIMKHGYTNNSGAIASKRPLIGITGGGVVANEQYVFDDGTTGTAPITGVLVISVTEGMDAATKLRPGDIIVEVDDRPVTIIQDVMAIINNKRGGDTVKIKFYRDGEYMTVAIILGIEQ